MKIVVVTLAVVACSVLSVASLSTPASAICNDICRQKCKDSWKRFL